MCNGFTHVDGFNIPDRVFKDLLEYPFPKVLFNHCFEALLDSSSPVIAIYDVTENLKVGVHPFFDLLDDIEQVSHPLE